jgi:hypothetical protein
MTDTEGVISMRAQGVVLFAHGNGSSRHGLRNRVYSTFAFA